MLFHIIKITNWIFLVLCFFFMLSYLVNSKPVTVETAKIISKNFGKRTKLLQTIDTIIANKKITLYHIFSILPNGFVIISGSERVNPILAYSNESNFDFNDIPSSVNSWLAGYKRDVIFAVENEIKATEIISNEWHKLTIEPKLANHFQAIVGPLILSKWGQGEFYNAQCPEQSPTGCIATAIAQILRYWKYPEYGVGYISYACPPFGELVVDFKNTIYDWDAMQYEPLSIENNAIATLMYHCGISVYTKYRTDASSAYTSSIHGALKNYFTYSENVTNKMRITNADLSWMNTLKRELDAGRPLIYNAMDAWGAGGHTFICDGYDNSNGHFHFNWGWDGKFDGWYYINTLNPNIYELNREQSVIINIEPSSTSVNSEQNKNFIFISESSDFINIDLIGLMENYSAHKNLIITDLLGIEILKISTSDDSFQINISNLNNGVYLIRINAENKLFSNKFIKY